MSHELKTPLAACRLQLELIERNLTPDSRTLVQVELPDPALARA